MNFKIYKLDFQLFLLNFFLIGILLNSCATYSVQQKNIPVLVTKDSSEVLHRFFLLGDAGNADEENSKRTLSFLKNQMQEADKNSTLMILGDNIYPLGMPPEDAPEYSLAKLKLQNQLDITKGFKGSTLLIPGNHDWYHGLKGLKAQERYVLDYFKNKKSFLPRNGCPIDKLKINDEINLITIDSEWFLEDWNQHPTINTDCDIRSREAFFDEFEDVLNKNQDKINIVAIHHPMMSGGSHGGHFSLKKQLFPIGNKVPLPIIGSLINVIRATSGISPQDNNSRYYQQLINRMRNIVQGKDNIVFVSGHDHNLQYLEDRDFKQVISGSGSKTEAAKVITPKGFSYGGNGYAVLDIMTDQSATLSFFGTQGEQKKLLATIPILEKKMATKVDYPTSFAKAYTTSVYPDSLVHKSKMYQWLWGKHYRKYYGTKIQGKTAILDTLLGGLQPVRAGGGHQSNSLRLEDKDGKQYVMRGIKKSAIRFLRSVAFKNEAFHDDFEGSFSEKFILDFYTTTHPYTPFAVGGLADMIGVGHSHPELYYIPKQKALQGYDDIFGDELYMVEERFSDSPTDLEELGDASATLNTLDLLKKIRKSTNNIVDEKAYIRARLLDMLIGDWDRHEDQWRWVMYKEGSKNIYKPIPKDRDQAFSKYDGWIMSWVMTFPALRHMQTFKEDIRNIKWLNREPYPLDLTILKKSKLEDWLQEAHFIKAELDDATIDRSFHRLPKEVQDETIEDIKRKLKLRRAKLSEYAQKYYKVLAKVVPIVGTDKEDRFVITKNNDGVTVQQFFKKDQEELVLNREYKDGETKELWIYGLNDQDHFEVKGSGKSKIKIRLIGGVHHDTYKVEDGKSIKVYDFKTRENTYQLSKGVRKIISDNYDLNTYDFKKPKYNFGNIVPLAGYNPDDGVKLGASYIYQVNGYKQNPFTQKHKLDVGYFFATHAAEVHYRGVFPEAIKNWGLAIEARGTTGNFTQNFYGMGNETGNGKDFYGKNYYRVRMQQLEVKPSVYYRSFSGIQHLFEIGYHANKVEQTEGRFIEIASVHPDVFKTQQFATASYSFSYDHSDSEVFPTKAFGLGFEVLYNADLQKQNRNFVKLKARMSISQALDNQSRWVLASKISGEYINNQHYLFYQGAQLGGDGSLRSFRNQRFIGDSFFFHSTDLRWNFGKVKNRITPITSGVYIGYDYGRVWRKGEDSQKWHQSVGGGLWLGILENISIRTSYFYGSDGSRLSAGIGMRF